MQPGAKKSAVVLPAFFGFLVGSRVLAAEGEEALEIDRLVGFVNWSGVATSLLIVAAAWLTLRFIRGTAEAMGNQFADRRLTVQKTATLLQFGVYVTATVLVVLLSFHIGPRELAFIGGSVAVAVGFAVKDLVASFVAGLMILVDRPFQVGDRVEFGGEYGDVTAIGLRSVRLRTLGDNVVTIPNNKFLDSITSCANWGALEMQVKMDFYVGLDQDVHKARELVQEAALSSRYTYLPRAVGVLVSELIVENYVAIRLRLKAYVLDTQYEKAFESDVTLRVLAAFQEHDIQPPAILHRGYGTRNGEGQGTPLHLRAPTLP